MLSNNKFYTILAIAIFSLVMIPFAIAFLKVTIDRGSLETEVDVALVDDSRLEPKSSDTGFDSTNPYVTVSPDFKKMLNGPTIGSHDFVFGDADSPVTITYFGDYECRFCLDQLARVKKIVSEKYRDRASLVWKDFPISRDEESIGYKTAMITRCAGDQDKFWEAQDAIIKNEAFELNQFASDLDLDPDEFVACYGGDEVKESIRENIKEANALSIEGVPFVYVNKQEFLGEISDFELERVIEIELR